MADTGYYNNRMVLKNRASGYSSTAANAAYVDMSVPYAAGGLYSTVEDLFRWDQALYTDKLISKPLRDEMFTPFVSIPGSEFSYGYGWSVGMLFSRQYVYHAGMINGFHSEIDRYPEDKVSVIVLSNREDAAMADVILGIARMIFGAK
jgi:CubicO group peptidase (beta-lactamase class C family)